jgi:ATP-dependent Clp protease, protease subunit
MGEGKFTMTMQGLAPQPVHYFIGFNLVIDRLATIRLMSAVGAAKDQGAQTITICISSVGGSPEQAFYAYEILRALPIPLTTHNVGTVQSAAVAIFMAGSTRYATPYSHFLLHETTHTSGGTSYTPELLAYSADSVRADDARAAAIIAERTKQDLKKVKKWLTGQKLRTAEFAKTHGIIDDIKRVQIPPHQSYFFQVTLG